MKCLGQHIRELTICRVPIIRERLCKSSRHKVAPNFQSQSDHERTRISTTSAKPRLIPQDQLDVDNVETRGSRSIHVLIALDVRVIRESLVLLLSAHSDVKVIAPGTLDAHLNQNGVAVDVVVLYARSDVEDVGNRIREAKGRWRGAKVVVVGVPDTSKDVLSYIEAGASGYILKSGSSEKLIQTIRAVHRGKALSSPDVLALLFDRIAYLKNKLQTVEDSDLSKLTQRELEVLQLVVDGMSNKEIATSLSLELQTVKNHVHNILEKLRVHSRHEAAMHFHKSGLLDSLS